ncbi:MAG: cytochrome c [Anaerolineae bacterium]|nr:cytochrome c [Anaerolineae bacterium]
MLGNIISLLVLLALAVVFAWLTRRAWTSRRGLVKWFGAVLAGLLTVISAATLVLALVGFYKLGQRHPNPIPTIQVARTSAQVARGEQLAHICANCHASNSQLPLSGTDFVAKFGLPPIGTFYSPNLTPGGTIDDWSDGEVIRAIREGIHKDGRSLLIMPAENYRHLSDDDAQSIVAYLRSQPPTGGPTPPNSFNVLGALFINLVDWRTAQPPVRQVSAPPPGTPAYGKYMVNILGCQDCHGAQLQGKLETGQPGPPPGPNLTQIVPQWTEDQFMTFFNTGKLPGGGTVPLLTLPNGSTGPRMPWTEVRASTTDDELKAMYTYLHSLPPIEGPAQ